LLFVAFGGFAWDAFHGDGDVDIGAGRSVAVDAALKRFLPESREIKDLKTRLILAKSSPIPIHSLL
jgi:hypothetical protein